MTRTAVLYLTPSSKLMGARISLLELLKRLDRTQYHPVVVCPHRGSFTEILSELEVETHVLPIRSWRKGKYFFYHPYVLSRIYHLLKSRRIDIVHANEMWVNPFAVFPARWSHRPVICHIRTSRTPSEISARKLCRYMINRVDRIVLISSSQRVLFSHLPHLSDRLELIPNGVDTIRFRPPEDSTVSRLEMNLPTDGPLIGLVGLITAHKGQGDLIKAAPAILARNPEARFLIVGNTRDQREIEQLRVLSGTLGLAEDRIIIRPFTNRIEKIYQSLDLLVCPSRQEAFGRVNIEAMASGIPVIAYSTGGIPEILEDGTTGLLLEEKTPSALAHAISTLLENPDQCRRISKAARCAVVQRFGMEAHTRAVQSLYEKVGNR